MFGILVIASILTAVCATTPTNPSVTLTTTTSSTPTPQSTSKPINPVCLASPELPCQQLPAVCLHCYFDLSCQYGQNISVVCQTLPDTVCSGPTVNANFTRYFVCRFCYQTPPSEHLCNRKSHCRVPGAPRSFYETSCRVRHDELCMGRREFQRMLPCNWTRGKSWVTTLLLSVFLGGFGADRFYLDMWREGLGKLFSFGGLGVWTIVDVILIAVGYVRPQDGSLYVEFMP